MSYNPFSIDNILGNSVPKRCRTLPEPHYRRHTQLDQMPSHNQQIQFQAAQYQTPLGSQQNSDKIGYTNPKEAVEATPEASPRSSPVRESPARSPVPATPVSSKSSYGSSPATSTPCTTSSNSDQGNISPCQVSPVPSSGSENDQEESKKKKARTSFSVFQIDQLERKFASQRYLGASERSQLAESLNLSDHQVKTWFQNRRMKEKRQIREAEERLGHPVTSLPGHMTLPSHLIMASSHAFHGRYSASEISPYMHLPTMPLGYNTLSVHPTPSIGHDMYQQPFSSPLAPQTSPIGHTLYPISNPLGVQVGF